MMRNIGITLGLLAFASNCLADAVDDVRAGTDMHYDLRSMTYDYTGAMSGTGAVADEDAPASCVPKAPATLTMSLDTASIGLPFSVIITMTGTKVSPTRIRWNFDTPLNQCVSITINGTATNVLLKRIWGQLTMDAGSLDPFHDSLCLRGYNVGLDDTGSNTDSWINAEAYAFCVQNIFTRINFMARNIDAIGFGGLAKGNVRPNRYNVTDGFELSGSLADIQLSDNNYLVVFNGDDLAADVEFYAEAPDSGLNTVQWTCESSVARPGLSYSASLYDWVAGSFQSLGGGAAPTVDSTFMIGVTSNGGKFIDSTTRSMVARMVWQPINDEDPSQDGWTHQIDYVRWYVAP